MNKEQRIAKENIGYKDKARNAAKKGNKKKVKDILRAQGVEVVENGG